MEGVVGLVDMMGLVGLVDMMGLMGLVGLVVVGGRVGRHVVVRLQSGQLVHLEGSEGKEWFLSNKTPTPTYEKQYCKTVMFTDK